MKSTSANVSAFLANCKNASLTPFTSPMASMHHPITVSPKASVNNIAAWIRVMDNYGTSAAALEPVSLLPAGIFQNSALVTRDATASVAA